ncbi:MAG TPA: farnesyl diphosphate synthase [Solirubrobacteraceae bacterium]|nr:farnesyl diphosphate synthase [Solirubrobacteraceae bacterium]
MKATTESPGTVAYPDYLREDVEAYLRELRFSAEPDPGAARGTPRGPDGSLTAGLEEAMRYSLLAGGKRIRPVLALATARAVGVDHGTMLPIAAALELIHTYSLIHDDLPAMDDDDLRRGRPTCHRAHGEDVAILAGDGLYAEAIHHLAVHQQADPAHVVAALTELAAATGVGGMVGGQYADVRGTAPADGDGLRRLHGLKTGRLIGASVLCPLLVSGVPEPATIDFRRFAAELGVLFQIVDDILDVTGTAEALGKPQGSDARHGKRTYVSEFGIERARSLAAESHRAARASLAAAAPGGAIELEQITDFIYTRTS